MVTSISSKNILYEGFVFHFYFDEFNNVFMLLMKAYGTETYARF